MPPSVNTSGAGGVVWPRGVRGRRIIALLNSRVSTHTLFGGASAEWSVAGSWAVRPKPDPTNVVAVRLKPDTTYGRMPAAENASRAANVVLFMAPQSDGRRARDATRTFWPGAGFLSRTLIRPAV